MKDQKNLQLITSSLSGDIVLPLFLKDMETIKLKVENLWFKFQENLVFFLVFVMFLPDFLRYPLFILLLFYTTYELIKYKDVDIRALLSIFIYLIFISIMNHNILGAGMTILFIGLVPYCGAVMRRMNAKEYMNIQYYVVWSSLFNFPFIYINYRPQWFLDIEKSIMGMFDVSHLPSWRLPPYLEGYYRAYSTFDNPNFYAFILLIVLVVCFNQIQFALTNKNYRKLLFYSGAFIINTYALVLTETRTLLVALAVSLSAIIVVQQKWNQLKAYVMIGCIGLAYIIINPSVLPRLLDISSNIGIRTEIWSNAFDVIQSNPWVGDGLMTYALHFDTTHAHNLYIELLLSIGLIGVGLFLVYLISVTIQYLKFGHYSDFPVLVALVLGTLVFGILEFPFYYLQTTYLYVMLLCLPNRKQSLVNITYIQKK